MWMRRRARPFIRMGTFATSSERMQFFWMATLIAKLLWQGRWTREFLPRMLADCEARF